MTLTLFLAAQADPLSGGSGWAGAGLLGLVLAWLLLVHMPARDKRDKEKDEAFLNMLSQREEKHDAAMAQQRSDFGSQLKAIADHCEKEMGSVAENSRAAQAQTTRAFFSAVEKLRAAINGEQPEKGGRDRGPHTGPRRGETDG